MICRVTTASLMLVFSVLAVVSASAQAAAAPEHRPNVILIFADDQGTLDLNCYGSKDLHTPHLDGLAKRGVRFTQFYVAAPVCSPSRAALLTGRYIQRAGVPGNVSSQPGQPGMPTEQVTLAELLKPAGYRTALFGKWHLGTIPECDPLGQGFDEFFGHKAGCIDNYSHFFYWRGPHFHDLWRNRTEHYENGTHFSSLIVRESLRFLDESKDQPFFLYLPFNIPHYPMQPDVKFLRMYKHLKEPRRAYAALVSHLDEYVGQVLKRVEQLNLTRKTLIIFLSDHGHSTEERCNFGGGNPGPYRGSKFSLFEAGIRVPCIVSMPGTLPEGEVRDQLCVSFDWFPTITEICGVKSPNRKIDGRSLLSVIRSSNAPSAHKTVHWQLGRQWAVRDQNWKLVVNARGTNGKYVTGPDKLFLSDFDVEITETKNLAGQYPVVVKRLTELHNEWAGQFKLNVSNKK